MKKMMNYRIDLDDMKNAMQDMVDSFDVLSKSIEGSYHCFVDLGNDMRKFEIIRRQRRKRRILRMILLACMIVLMICLYCMLL